MLVLSSESSENNILFIKKILSRKEYFMKVYTSSLFLVAVLLLGGCTAMTSTGIKNVEQDAITQTLTQAQIEKAILTAGAKRNWQMKVVSPGLIRGDLTVRTHQASIDIRYNERNFSITYVSSNGLGADGNGNIHRSYNKWVTLLDRTIQKELALTKNP